MSYLSWCDIGFQPPVHGKFTCKSDQNSFDYWTAFLLRLLLQIERTN